VVGFKLVPAITAIRNQLIEHQYVQLPDHGGSHSVMSARHGPVIQVRSRDSQPSPKHLRDPGFFVNAAALRRSLSPVLRTALQAVGGPVTRESVLGSGARQADSLR
jgi:hypothetical protein